MTTPAIHVRPLGDRAVLVEVGNEADDLTRRRVHALWSLLAARPLAGVFDVVPGLASVVLHYEPSLVERAPGVMPHAAISQSVRARVADLSITEQGAARSIEIPACYHADVAPDLAEVARHAGMTTEEVVALHSAGDYVVHMIGFLPGFPYLSGLDPRLTIPRRSSPRVRVPAGSIGIGGSLTGIYPLESPGGWQLIGRTSASLFSADREEPTLLRIGDRVRFRAVSLDELQAGSGR